MAISLLVLCIAHCIFIDYGFAAVNERDDCLAAHSVIPFNATKNTSPGNCAIFNASEIILSTIDERIAPWYVVLHKLVTFETLFSPKRKHQNLLFIVK